MNDAWVCSSSVYVSKIKITARTTFDVTDNLEADRVWKGS